MGWGGYWNKVSAKSYLWGRQFCCGSYWLKPQPFFYIYLFIYLLLFVTVYCCLATWGEVGTEIKCQQRVNSEEDNSPAVARIEPTTVFFIFIYLFVTFCSSLLFSYVTEAACFRQQMSQNLSCTVTKAVCFWWQLSQNLSCTLSQKLCVLITAVPESVMQSVTKALCVFHNSSPRICHAVCHESCVCFS